MNLTSHKTDLANVLFQEQYETECMRVNVFMKWLMIAQWFVGIGFALFYSPLTWIGQHYEVHVHVWAAILLGGSLSGITLLWLHLYPKATHSRHLVAASQMLWSALLIHLSGGRIETHFHVFASLAILSIYRDWKILITATVVVAIDHFVRGVFYPLSAFGIVAESPYRWIEHAAWVLFEIAFLAPGAKRLRDEITELCRRQTEIEEAKRSVDLKVEERTRDLVAANDQLALKTEEAEKLALVAQYTHSGVLITDGDSRVDWANEGFSRITGYSLPEIKDHTPFDFQRHSKTSDNAIQEFVDAVQRGEGHSTEIECKRKNGDSQWLSIEARPIKGESDSVDRFIVIQSDISERKRFELSLSAAERRLRSIMDNVPGAFYRRSANQQKRMLFISRSIKSISGHNPDAFANEESFSVHDLIVEEDREKVFKALDDAIDQFKSYNIEYRITTRDGETRWVWERGQCVVGEQDDNPMVLDSMLFDVTDRVEAEHKNLKLQQELVDASRQAGMAEVATGVLHNVGNILNSLNVSTSMIQKRFAKSAIGSLEKVSGLIGEYEDTFADFVRDDNRGQKIPRYILKVTDALRTEHESITDEFDALVANVDHIKQIVNLQQSMAKSDGMMQTLNAEETIRDVINAIKGSFANHHVNVETLFETDDHEFTGDKHKILQILINLVKNGKDALVDNDTPDPLIRVTFSRDSGEACFTVSDNGIGIAEDQLSKIFHHGFTTKNDGHGFGLHSSANAANEMGGELTVASEGVGKGATFKLRLKNQSQTVAV